ncbi:hypothetical protein EDD17DRAFT_512964 [Pisolithus thermaeus]|nr:hypothetical protein EV401DRAFT_872969 [Pisolithus croceorrhizus]KAI6163117.1 hypothetical protein EDD17DRAFT_512964 [Pisolithus thermaeus]
MTQNNLKSDPAEESSKVGYKFYAFFRSRSRSRSRSKSVIPTNAPPPMLSKFEAISITQTHSLSSRRPRLSTEHIPSNNPPSSYMSSPTKSTGRSQSRPISSTTTATHSTIAPLPSDSLRKAINGRQEYASRHGNAANTHELNQDHDQYSESCDHDVQQLPPRSETPSSTKRKLGLHTLFGITLTRRSSSRSARHPASISPERKASTSTLVSESSRNVTSRRRSLRLGSRPTTPKSSDQPFSPKSSGHFIPVPSNPLPLSASPRRRSFGLNSPHNTPKSSVGHLPLPVVHRQSHGRRHSVGAHQTPHDSAVALPEEQPNTSKYRRPSIEFIIKPSKGKEKQSEDWGKSRAKVALQAPASGAEPISQNSSENPPIGGHSLYSPSSGDCVEASGGARPRIQHLPTVESISDETGELPLLAPRPIRAIPKIIHTPPTPQRPGDSSTPLRPSTTPPKVDSSKVKVSQVKMRSIPREELLSSTLQSHADTSTAFKLPPEPSEPAANHSRFTPRFFRGQDSSKTKESGLDKPSVRGGLPNGSAQARHMSNHRSKLGSFDFERPVSAGLNHSSSTINRSQNQLPLERTTSSDSPRATKSRLATYQLARVDSPVHSHLIPSHTGQTSVISFASIPSKSTEKGASSNLSPGQSSSWGRASGRRMQKTSHGTFPFEHPASSPSSPLPDSFNPPNSTVGGQRYRDVTARLSPPPPDSPWVPIYDVPPKHHKGQSQASQDVDGSLPKQERKAKGKGRSMDLGLGLAWAPSRVREEAIIPGLFVAGENIRANGRSYGSDVTKAFESILSATDFEAFKKYVRRYDAHVIPFDGPNGLLTRVEKLLLNTGISERERKSLLAEFAYFVENHDE